MDIKRRVKEKKGKKNREYERNINQRTDISYSQQSINAFLLSKNKDCERKTKRLKRRVGQAESKLNQHER